jgi:hypothetical protein
VCRDSAQARAGSSAGSPHLPSGQTARRHRSEPSRHRFTIRGSRSSLSLALETSPDSGVVLRVESNSFEIPHRTIGPHMEKAAQGSTRPSPGICGGVYCLREGVVDTDSGDTVQFSRSPGTGPIAVQKQDAGPARLPSGERNGRSGFEHRDGEAHEQNTERETGNGGSGQSAVHHVYNSLGSPGPGDRERKDTKIVRSVLTPDGVPGTDAQRDQPDGTETRRSGPEVGGSHRHRPYPLRPDL